MNGGGHTRKGKGRAVEDSNTALSRRRERQDEEIEGSDSENDDGDDSDAGTMRGAAVEEEFESDDEAERKETPAQKRLRLAQQYLDSLKAAQSGELLSSLYPQPVHSAQTEIWIHTDHDRHACILYRTSGVRCC